MKIIPAKFRKNVGYLSSTTCVIIRKFILFKGVSFSLNLNQI